MNPIEQMREGLNLFIGGLEAAMNQTSTAPVYMTSNQAAEEISVHPSTISTWCKTGRIDGAVQSQKRGHWRFTRQAFNAAMRRSA